MRKVIFVCSGNSRSFEVVPFIQTQADSLNKIGMSVNFFTVKGKGALAYLSHINILASHLKTTDYDVIHAHYSFCGFIAVFATLGRRKPVVVSLMGSDVKTAGLWLTLIRFFARVVWDATIVKSEDMHKSLRVKCAEIIPNGVNLKVFIPLNRTECRVKLNLDVGIKYILFGADPSRDVKNYPLALRAMKILLSDNSPLMNVDCELINLGCIPHNQVPIYLNACDVLLITSKWEGSPNIVKEAMACGTPIVCTDVGDARWLLEGLEGCFVSTHDPHDIAKKLSIALRFKGKTKGRDKLIELGLDSESVANRIVDVYMKILKKR